MTDEPVLLSDRPAGGVLRLLLNRPARRNAIDRVLVEALLDAFSVPDAASVVLGSSTPGMFCSGADVTLADAERAGVSDALHELYARMVAYPAPIVAAVDGHAVGGGAQLAVASDLRVAGPRASFTFAGAGHGLSVGAWALPALVGRGRALDLCLTIRPVGAAEALRIGLVDRVEEDADAAAVALAVELAQLVPEAAARVKRVVAASATLLPALELERAGNRAWSGSMAAADAQ
jgi:enoyl-CoA hydratase/carnithine racemase